MLLPVLRKYAEKRGMTLIVTGLVASVKVIQKQTKDFLYVKKIRRHALMAAFV